MTTNKEPAFPSGLKEIDCDELGAINTGMTLRDYFSAKAMSALIIALPNMQNPTDGDGKPLTEAAISAQAYYFADAMMKARKA